MLVKLLLLLLLKSLHHQTTRNCKYSLFILKKPVQWQVSCDAFKEFRVQALNLSWLNFEICQ